MISYFFNFLDIVNKYNQDFLSQRKEIPTDSISQIQEQTINRININKMENVNRNRAETKTRPQNTLFNPTTNNAGDYDLSKMPNQPTQRHDFASFSNMFLGKLMHVLFYFR